MMVCLGFKPIAAGWLAQMKPWSYGGHPVLVVTAVVVVAATPTATGVATPFWGHQQWSAAELMKADKLPLLQCDQIGQFIGLWAIF